MDRNRAVYHVMLIELATCYVLFAAMAVSQQGLLLQIGLGGCALLWRSCSIIRGGHKKELSPQDPALPFHF